jgi:plastocyanin
MAMKTQTPKMAALLGSAAIVVATACGQSTVSHESVTTSAPAATPSAAAPASPAPAEATITITNFEMSDVTVAPGGRITVQNDDREQHTVTSNAAGAFSVDIPGRSKTTFTAPMKPGSYPFHCNYHASMHGMLTVQ